MGAAALLGQSSGNGGAKSLSSGADESRARARRGQGTNKLAATGTGGSGMAQARMQGARALEGKSRGGPGGKNERTKMSPPPSFYRAGT